MSDLMKSSVLRVTITVICALSAFMPVSQASAEQTGSFMGSWVASGKLQPFEFLEGRHVGTFNLAGNVSLKNEFGGTEDFWAECVGLSDSVTGSSVRCVWRSLKGVKAFSVLSGEPLKEGVKVTGEFIGGTGSLKGVEGTFTFTWTSTFVDESQGVFTGHTKDLSGQFQIP